MEQQTVLKMQDITKLYPGVVALDRVSIEFKAGEVHALLGENGAGKSTLIKILSGAIQNDGGKIWLNGREYDKMTPSVSRENGVEVIYQEYNLVPGLTVAENVCLGSQMKGLVDMKAMIRTTQELFRKYNITIDPKSKVRDISAAQQQLVEITKALSKNARILVMDEPTAQLTQAEVLNLYKIINSLKDQGKTVIYISHRLEELFAVTDCVTILRDGQYVRTVRTKETNRDELIALMVGRELKSVGVRVSHASEEIVLKAENISGFYNDNVSFELRKGEILGFSGLVGAGRTELMRVIYGADKKTGGVVYINGKPTDIRSPEDAIKNGIGLVPEDRKMQGCFLGRSIEWNISLGNIRKLTTGGLIDSGKITKQAREYQKMLNIKAPSLKQKVQNLSGGNQQKVVLAKVLAANTDIVIFDEPTRGIDVGARAEIYELMENLVTQGKSIIMISSDMEELLAMSDRIIVLCEGKYAGELAREEFSQETILDMASNE